MLLSHRLRKMLTLIFCGSVIDAPCRHFPACFRRIFRGASKAVHAATDSNGRSRAMSATPPTGLEALLKPRFTLPTFDRVQPAAGNSQPSITITASPPCVFCLRSTLTVALRRISSHMSRCRRRASVASAPEHWLEDHFPCHGRGIAPSPPP